MKKYLIILLALTLTLCAQNLITNPDGSNDFRGYFKIKGAAITSKDGVIQIHGVEANETLNRYQKAQCTVLKAAKLAKGRTFVLSFSCRAAKNSGAVQIACREAYADNNSFYHGFILKRYDIPREWTTFKKEFTTKDGSKDLSLYILAYYLLDDDLVEIKDLSLTEKK